MIMFLLKFNLPEYNEQLLDGHLYINHSTHFTKKTDGTIHDEKEGVSKIIHITNQHIEIQFDPNEDYKKLFVSSGVFEERNDLSNVHIYSLYQITEDIARNNQSLSWPERIKNEKSWTSCVIIKKPGLFIQQVCAALTRMNYPFEFNEIQYYEPDQNQLKLTAFDKRKEYEYQNEVRFLINQGTKEPFRLDIGSIRDFSEMVILEKCDGLQFQWPDQPVS